MIHMHLARMAGEVDVDKVANSLTQDQLLEWWAFGAIFGWLPVDEEKSESGSMSVAESEAAAARLYG